MDSMLEAFIGETRENLETAGRCFLALEKQPGDDTLMNDLFRAIHTIKGSSGLFDIPSFTKVVHVAEDVLDRARGGELELNSEHIDLFLDTMDQINIWLDDLESNERLGDNADELSLNLAQALRELLGVDTAQTEAAEDTLDPETDENQTLSEAPAWIAQIPEPLRIDLFKQDIAQNSGVWSIEYDPDAQSFFSGEDPLHTMRNLPGLVWFQIQAKDPWPPTDELNPYHCNLIFRGIANVERTELHHYLRYIPEQVQLTPFSALGLIFPHGDYGDSEPFLSFIQDAQQAIETETWNDLGRIIAPLLQFSGPDLLQTSALNWMDALLKQDVPHIGLLNALLITIATGEFSRSDVILEETSTAPVATEPAGSVEEDNETQPCTSQALNASQLAAVKLVIETQMQILTLPCTGESRAGRIASTAVVLKNLLSSMQQETIPLDQATREAQEQESLAPLVEFLSTHSTDFAPQEDTAIPSKPTTAAASAPMTDPSIQEKLSQGDRRQGDRRQGDRRTGGLQQETGQAGDLHKVIKVDQHRIDTLMDLVGELVVAKNALPFLAKKADEDFGVREISKEILAQYAVINRLSDELQGAMMQIRMVPVSSVFQRFPRLVRDLSRKLEKRIELVLEGEETEADKNVVENLSDPLI
ncbi:MAG: Hpt domain-containing protein, partial [Geopsychrobacter sp.]|nr:Hpt domain-containing protein [Geopsychrobacter sp.]